MTPGQTGPRHLFVYGTLKRRSRSPLAGLLRERAVFEGDGFVHGRLYRLGHFPGAVLDSSQRFRVHGEAFRLRDLKLLFALDRYEGVSDIPPLFVRTIAPVSLANGSIDAWIYTYAGDVTGRPLISSGIFPVNGSTRAV
jgi:gamma-glutamylcyclotransferase (GGCT)/AIG2-like uncharacterized protein YtfP